MFFRIYRDSDTMYFRKVVIELYNADGSLLDRRRMFAFPLFNFERRLEWWKGRMLRCGTIMLDAMEIEDEA